MPRIQFSGHTQELHEIADCEHCGRTIYCDGKTGFGYIAKCGRRLVNLAEFRNEGCPIEQKQKGCGK